ncbi:MAG: hypothetical protein KDE46_09925, partial [Caldilineaceae bacterium]|nr:hypothetical protein [Caldilineaceae bacterium]
MSQLASGIKLILSGADMTVAPRYWINYGTMPAVAYPKPLRNYDSAARVPHPEWRVPDVVEEQLLYGDNSAEIGS